MSDYKLKWNGQQVIKLSEKATELALEHIAIDVHREAVRSAPVDTGRLKGSLAYSVNGDNSRGSKPVETSKANDDKIRSEKNMATVGTNVEYAIKMEYGGSKQAPEGYLRPASDKVRPKIPQIVQKYFKKELG